MNETKFTPAPWYVCKGDESLVLRNREPALNQTYTPPPLVVANIQEVLSNAMERVGNAALISAAPDMYSLLKEMLSSDRCDIAYFKISVENVLKKARGEEQDEW